MSSNHGPQLTLKQSNHESVNSFLTKTPRNITLHYSEKRVIVVLLVSERQRSRPEPRASRACGPLGDIARSSTGLPCARSRPSSTPLPTGGFDDARIHTIRWRPTSRLQRHPRLSRANG